MKTLAQTQKKALAYYDRMIKVYHKTEKREVRTSSWEFPTFLNSRADFVALEFNRLKIGVGIINYIMRGNQYPRLRCWLRNNYDGWHFHFGINNGLYQFTISVVGR